MADQFFRNLGPEWAPPVLFGVGSAEGIAAELELRPGQPLILHFDELKHFVDKAKNEGSVALPMVSTLFERGDYDNRTKKEHLSVRDATLTMVAACTVDTYSTLFDQRFLAIGFLNRLWLVADRTTKRIAVPAPLPLSELNTLCTDVQAALKRIDVAWRQNGNHAVVYKLTPEAHAVFTSWYEGREPSIFAKRLDTYGHRLMLLLAAMNGRDVIDRDIAEAVVALLHYQLEVRRESDPVDADNVVAAMEQKIRRKLARGSLKARDLKKGVHYERYGIWCFVSGRRQSLGHTLAKSTWAVSPDSNPTNPHINGDWAGCAPSEARQNASLTR